AEEGPDALGAALHEGALAAQGRLTRPVAARVRQAAASEASPHAPGRRLRCSALSVTSVALSPDDATAFSTTKDGALWRHDVETGARTQMRAPGGVASSRARLAAQAGAPWVFRPARGSSSAALLAVAVSDDGQYVAAAGVDRAVHVWEARSGEAVCSLPGHRDTVTSLAFRGGTHDLYSGSLDRSVKLWSLDEQAYVDTLFGHQAGILGLSALRAPRVLSAGADRTCRLFKVDEESHLVFRGHCPVQGAAQFVNLRQWVSGDDDGSVCLWDQSQRKPVCTLRHAHGHLGKGRAGQDEAEGGPEAEGEADDKETSPSVDVAAPTPTTNDPGATAGWVSAVAACPGSDLVATGAGDGAVRLWAVETRSLRSVGNLPVEGYVNGLALARSARFAVAGVGQEPRLGRWARQGGARNGVHVLPIALEEE
ncbi:hypothetical protein H632_c2946p0, partial [Helicosporidium sp. ATCC 50920]